MGGAGKVGVLYPYPKLYVAAAHGDKPVPVAGQVARHKGEQVAGLGIGIVPDRPVAAIFAVTLLYWIAISEQDWKRCLIRRHAHAVARQYIGPIGKEGYAAEPLRLALGA